ncbi:DUF6766 family protein [Amaricoccus sp. W119]|uniref:DUF6766 family protein n=1 Tax=Amaricoccus sp. W119 TaxID=3391833 RepID=UPI0039A5AD77
MRDLPSRFRAPRRFLRDNGLSLVLVALFAVSIAGMILTGQADLNVERARLGEPPVGVTAYLGTGDFLSALFENWESEFLQMSIYVVLTAVLFQRGSSESRDPDASDRPDDTAPWRGHPFSGWIYEHSLGLALVLLFLASFLLHWWFSMSAANAEAVRVGAPPLSLAEYLLEPKLWFESFQNWQSEFLSTAVLVVLSIFLRQKGSPESKPVGAQNAKTGG